MDVAPKDPLEVFYKTYRKKVNFGNIVLPKESRSAPQVQYKSDDNKYYTLIMTDPDAPTYQRPDRREWLQWVVTNIPGDDVKEGMHLAEYVPPMPRPGSGYHRVVLLVYPQPEELLFNEMVMKAKEHERGDFSSRKFVKKYRMGEPIAGNFFNTQNDETVRFGYEQYCNSEARG